LRPTGWRNMVPRRSKAAAMCELALQCFVFIRSTGELGQNASFNFPLGIWRGNFGTLRSVRPRKIVNSSTDGQFLHRAGRFSLRGRRAPQACGASVGILLAPIATFSRCVVIRCISVFTAGNRFVTSSQY
jgi:hypothetical protein